MRPIDADELIQALDDRENWSDQMDLAQLVNVNIYSIINSQPTIRDKSMREFFYSEQLRPMRYRMKFKNDQVSRYTERLYKAGYARGYSEGLEKGLALYRKTAAEIREIISEGRKE